MSRGLPPLNAVRAFEAASRHLNLSRAAEELGVTQGAISKQVSSLEDFIGAQLFERTPAGLSLTQEGYTLKEALMPAFAMLGEAFVRYSRRPPRSTICRISTTASFAGQFLVPRLPAFRQRRPDIEIEFITSIRLVDLAREEVDIGIRYGLGEYDGLVSARLTDGVLAPVGRPDLVKKFKGDLHGLLNSCLRIQTAGFNEWRAFGEQANLPPELAAPNYVIEDFLVALKAVLTGQGLVLLPEILVRDQIKSGELALFSDKRVTTAHTFHLAHTTAAVRRPAVQDVIAWLRAEAAG